MDSSFVVDSKITGSVPVEVPGGSTCTECTIACEGAVFAPGQYLMVRVDGCGVSWPYPYIISGAGPEGYRVLANVAQPLAACKAGDVVQYWGPRGSAATGPDEALLLVAQPETAHLLQPFAGPQAQWTLLGQEPVEGLARKMDTEKVRKALVALNPDTLLALDAALSDDARARSLLFVSNKKACGFDACKGCYLHSQDDAFGINVCCRGPFMPYETVDLEQDIKCFETFGHGEVPK